MIYTVTLNPAVDRELTVPEFEFNSVLRATAWQVDFGGKGFNVSRMLRSLGAPSTALAFTGGKSGELLRDGLVSLGIDTGFIWVEGETRTNVSIVNEVHDRYLKVNEPGPTIGAQAQAALLDEVRTRAAPGSWWVLAGSLPPGVPADYYAQITAAVREQGGQVVLDTSGAALQHGCAAGPALVKPNDHELQQLTGMPVASVDDIVAAAHAVRSMGPAHVVVSMGKAGALAVDGDGAWLIAAPRIAEQNPIGAGDSLVAGLVWALDRADSLAEALRWGVACGAATAASPGTAVGERAAVEQLYGQTSVQPLAAAAR
jgi:1-phosphofructokinase family hexose kinase